MIDVQQADEFYDLAIQHFGKPPLTATFDRRVLLPLTTVAQSLSAPEGPTVTEAQVREFAAKRWVTILRGAETEVDANAPGLPIYALNRLHEYLALSAAGFTDAELAAHADFEEGVVDAVCTADALAYVDDDVEQLVHDHECTRRELSWDREDSEAQVKAGVAACRRVVLDREAVEARLAKVDRDLAYLRRLDRRTLADAGRHRLGRFAHRVRQRNEMTRGLLVAWEYGQMQAGYSFFVDFAEHGLGEEGFYFRKPVWGSTLHHPLATQETSRLPIRVPGFVLVGDHITQTRTLNPDEYRALWEAADLDDYRATLKIVWGEKECPHCRRPVGKGRSAKRVYCSSRCAQAARQARYRERNPEAVKLAQRRWRRS